MTPSQLSLIAQKFSDFMADQRHYFHAHPELSWQEVETTKKIEAILSESGMWDLKVGFDPHVRTGIVADFHCSGSGPLLAVRADIDALPVTEQLDVPWKSTCEGKMHACGHDSHIAMALGLAKAIEQHPEILSNHRLRLIFQPAEEKGCGAEKMIQGGALNNVSCIFGAHIWSSTPLGKIETTDGPFMAEADLFSLQVTGKGGHGSMPHLSIDPLLAGAAITQNLQSLVSRETDPLDTFVLSVCCFQSGTTGNVIPQETFIQGTTRFFDLQLGDRMMERVEQIAKATALAYRCDCQYTRTKGAHPTINHKKIVDFALKAWNDDLPNVAYLGRPTMAGEDFGNYLEHVPGMFFFVGTGDKDQDATYPQHHPRFRVLDQALPTGLHAFLSLLYRYDLSNS